MTGEEWNVWAQEKNRQPGTHAQYYLNEPNAFGGTSAVKDPYYNSSEYLNSAQSPYGEPTADASLMWSSGSPNDIMYSSGGNWNPLTEEALLGNPDMLSAFNTQLNTGGPAQSAYQAFNTGMSPEAQAQITGLSGSSHSLAPEILGKMWNPPQP